MPIAVTMCKTNNHLKDNGYTQEEEAQIYEDTLADVIANTRWYLDNLDSTVTYRVSFRDYTTNPTLSAQPTLPLKHMFKRKAL